MIDRKKLVNSHNPILNKVDSESLLTVGNGQLAYSVDVTGMQTFYEDYLEETPLCTMAQWGWHTTPVSETQDVYSLADVKMDEYDFCGRKVTYARTKQPGNEAVYDWLRMNPHKFNLARVGLTFRKQKIEVSQISNVHQKLNLYDGIIESSFILAGCACRVQTFCAWSQDTLGFVIESDLLKDGLGIELSFPYADGNISGSDWNAQEKHTTSLKDRCITRKLDKDQYFVFINDGKEDLSEDTAENTIESTIVDTQKINIEQSGKHRISISTNQNKIEFTLHFSKEYPDQCLNEDNAKLDCLNFWHNYWEKGGMIQLSESKDQRAKELERRIILSLYLLAINCSGEMPPQETGLTCNSWFGKAHLEMHFWHMAWAPLWNHSELLERSIPWYKNHLQQAWDNASRNGYIGARWPKMVGDDALDSPSKIAPLLVWQQPHIIMLLELIRRSIGEQGSKELSFMRENWVLVKETADFMADFVVMDEKTGIYHIESPVIPVQERHLPEETKDPAFEVAYWKFGLRVAQEWADKLAIPENKKWTTVKSHMAPPPQAHNLYIAQANCPDTFDKKAIDHPLMLQNLGMLPGEKIDRTVMKDTLETVLEKWDYTTLWGWDFAVISMTAVRLGLPQLAVDQLLCNSLKNCYVTSGNNRQNTRKDLPLYLPGNGALLLAVAMMAAGYDGNKKKSPGFPDDGKWKIIYEGLQPYI